MRFVKVATATLLAFVISVGSAVTPITPVSSASAATTMVKPTISLAYGDNSLTLAWKKVTGATQYFVYYSTNSRFSGAKKLITKSTNIFIKGLTNDRRYYVKVTADGPGPNQTSSVKYASPDSGYPRELAVTVVPAGTNKIKVSWTGQGRATKVGVIAGSESSVMRHTFKSRWYPATTKSVILTVPEHYRYILGSGSGNPIFVKVATYNNDRAGTSMPTVKSDAASYRLTLAGKYTWPTPATPTGGKIKVATYNTRSVTSSAGEKGYTWLDRRKAVAATVAKSGVDLFGTQEMTTSLLPDGKTTQLTDFQNLMSQSVNGGYKIATPFPEDLKLSRVNAPYSATAGAHLFYKPSVLTRLDGGLVSPKSLNISWPTTLTDRYFSWGKFRVNATGKEFYAVTVHFPVDDKTNNISYHSLRVREAKAIDAFISAKAGSTPIVFMGDFNSAFGVYDQGPNNVLVQAGYYDTAAALSRSGWKYSTVNTAQQVDNLSHPGYPYTPYVYKYAAQRIDYILIKNFKGAYRHVNQVVLTSTGKFDRAYQGSDHNLQWSEIGL